MIISLERTVRYTESGTFFYSGRLFCIDIGGILFYQCRSLLNNVNFNMRR